MLTMPSNQTAIIYDTDIVKNAPFTPDKFISGHSDHHKIIWI